MVKIEGYKCLAYFRGSDGCGTCDTECQWYVEGSSCPWWLTEEEWLLTQKESKGENTQ